MDPNSILGAGISQEDLTSDWCSGRSGNRWRINKLKNAPKMHLVTRTQFLKCSQKKFFFFFRAAPMAHGSSQARGWIGATAASLYQSQQCWIQAVSVTYTTAHANAWSLTHWTRPGIEPLSSWILVGLVTAEPCWQLFFFFNLLRFKFDLYIFHCSLLFFILFNFLSICWGFCS